MKRLACGNHDCDQPCHSGDCKEYTETSEFFCYFSYCWEEEIGAILWFSHTLQLFL